MARLAPRLRVRSNGNAFMAGLTYADFDFFIELVKEYTSEGGSHEYQYLVDDIENRVSPKTYLTIKRQNGTVTIEVNGRNRHACQGLFHLRVLASIGLHAMAEQKLGKDNSYMLLHDRSGEPMPRMHSILEMLEKDSDRERQELFYPEYMSMRSLSTATPLEKSRRMAEVKMQKRYRTEFDHDAFNERIAFLLSERDSAKNS